MKITKIIFFVFVIFSLFSCSDINSVVDDYNSKYQQGIYGTISHKSLSPDDENFEAENMLADKYFVRNDGSINLYGPPDASSYLWELKKIVTETKIGFTGMEIITTTEEDMIQFSIKKREFICYIPNSTLENGSYRLILTVSDKEGNKYTDSCLLSVYQPLNQD